MNKVRELMNQINIISSKYDLGDPTVNTKLMKSFVTPKNMLERENNEEYKVACDMDDKTHLDSQYYTELDKLVVSFNDGHSVSGVHLYSSLRKAGLFKGEYTAEENIGNAVDVLSSVVFKKESDKKKWLDTAKSLLESTRPYLENLHKITFVAARIHLEASREYIEKHKVVPVSERSTNRKARRAQGQGKGLKP